MIRRSLLGTAVFALSVALAGVAQASRGEKVCDIVVECAFTLAQSVEKALGGVPGTVLEAGFDIERLATGERVAVHRVVILDSNGEVQVLFYDCTTGEPITPTPPTLTLLEAMQIALDAVRAANGGLADPIVIHAEFNEDLFRPAYRLKILDSRGKLLGVRVDGLSGEADIHNANKKKKKRGLRCNDGDSDDDSDSDSDGDSDGDSDS